MTGKTAKRFTATLRDQEGSLIELIWFKGISYMQQYVRRNTDYMVFGKPSFFKQKVSIAHPEMEMISEETELNLDNRFEAIYSSTEKTAHPKLRQPRHTPPYQNIMGTNRRARPTRNFAPPTY
jgi:RecG-like helicase